MTVESRRIAAVDIVRGVAVVLMAIDHVRVYAGVPAGGPDPGVFFTRWVTHFVAPIFAFLAGTAAYLYGQRIGDRGRLSRWLATRGLWLVFLELTIVRLGWTFNFDFASGAMAGVIWMLGWCMVLLALLVQLPLRAIFVIGLVLVVGHNASNFISSGTVESLTEGPAGAFWKILYFGGYIPVSGEAGVFILYSIIPWIGVMALGYVFGVVAQWPPDRRNRFCLRLGAAMTITFILLRLGDVYGDPNHWREMDHPFAFIATTKYPASLLFLLMTLGPGIALIAVADRLPELPRKVLATFGSVPFFYYLLHIPLIHLLAVFVSLVRTGSVEPWLFLNHPAMVPPAPQGYTWSLPLLYLVTAIALLILYPLCLWYSALKRRKQHPILSYL